MPTSRKVFLAIATIVLLGSGGVAYEAHLVRANRAQLAALRMEEGKLRAELAALERQQAERARTLAAAQAESASLPPLPAGAAAANDPVTAEIEPWLDRLQTLKRMFAGHPELGVPEMAQLTELEWLFIARKSPVDTETQLRQSLAAVRAAAKEKFAQQMASALRKYTAASGGELPPNPHALASHFIRTLDPAMFARYEMVRSGKLDELPDKNSAGVVVIRERVPVDEDFDTRYGVTANGMRYPIGRGPRGWVPALDGYDGMVSRAKKQFSQANNGAKPASLEQLTPFLDPLPPALLQKLLQLDREQKN